MKLVLAMIYLKICSLRIKQQSRSCSLKTLLIRNKQVVTEEKMHCDIAAVKQKSCEIRRFVTKYLHMKYFWIKNLCLVGIKWRLNIYIWFWGDFDKCGGRFDQVPIWIVTNLEKIHPNIFDNYCVVCPSSIYAFWLPLWYLQTLLI